MTKEDRDDPSEAKCWEGGFYERPQDVSEGSPGRGRGASSHDGQGQLISLHKPSAEDEVGDGDEATGNTEDVDSDSDKENIEPETDEESDYHPVPVDHLVESIDTLALEQANLSPEHSV